MRLAARAMPLLLRLLLPLVLLAGSVRSALLWRDQVRQAADATQLFVASFQALYGPRIVELQALAQPAELQAVLEQAVRNHPQIAQIVWRSEPGPAQSASAIVPDFAAPQWVGWLQGIDNMPSALKDSSRTLHLSHPQAQGALTLELSAVPDINRIWRSVRVQISTVAGVLVVLIALIPLVLLSSLRGLTQLSRTALLLPVQPWLRITPAGAREVRQLAHAFNAMAADLQLAHSQAQQQLQRTTWVATHDELTGLPNRSLLADRLQQALHRCERHNELLGLCFVDLDHFKPINDQYGHPAGDEVLKTAATRMQAELRDTDTLARIGGDEFVLLLTSLQEPLEALAIIERVLSALRQPIPVAQTVVQISGSAGLTLQGPVDSNQGCRQADADLLLRQADQAMYLAKQAGRNCVRVWQSDQTDAVASQQQWTERLSRAAREGELRLHYQPKVNLVSGKVVGLEALVRWQHPERGLLPPIEFLPLVENTPAIIDIGNWVMLEALRQMGEWTRAGHAWPVSINVAARQLMQPDFMTHLSAALLHAPQVNPGGLTLEILETSALDDLAQVSATVRDAQSLGVHCSLDDFGTGYSSLSYLKELPVHEIKIDQSFVRHMLDDTGDLALVEGVISLGLVFGRQIVAEGMETAEHGVMLVRLGCQVAQGWAIAKPMPAIEVVPWMACFRPDPLWQQWHGSSWDLTDFPLLVARRDHLKWVEKVMAALDGKPLLLSPDELALHTHCRFGVWYQGAGHQQYRHLTAFKAINPVHREVHRLGREIIRLRDAGQQPQAKIVAQSLLICQTRMLQHLDHLQRDVLAQDQPAQDQLAQDDA